MDIESLRLFVEVMRRGSFAAVARDRNLDPSSISRAIRSLEDELGARLFQRTTRALTPSESAAAYFDRIAAAIDEIEKANLIVRDVANPASGQLRVTTSVAFGKQCLVPVLPDFMKAYPELTIELLLSDSVLDLVSERIDVAIRLGLLPDSTLVAHKLLPARYSVVASPDYLAKAAHALEKPADLQMHQCVLFSYAGFRNRWIFRERDGSTFEVPVAGRVFTQNAIGVLEGARAGIGPALLGDWLTGTDVRRNRLVQLFPGYEVTATSFDTAVWFIYPSKTYLPLKVRVFLDYLRTALANQLDTPAV
jgi:DNA-binding transcriptional LysR family regulator